MLQGSDRPWQFARCRIGMEGQGMQRTKSGFFTARILISSTCLGLAEECLALATDWAKQAGARV